MPSNLELGANKLNLTAGTQKLLREAQLGALWAVGAHFTRSTENALISLPTGTGKTLVGLILPYFLKSKRVLFVTPNKIIRNQVLREFSSFELPAAVELLPKKFRPKTKIISRQIRTENDWLALQEWEILVATPHVCSPGYEQIPDPPKGLFDLIIVDEAHHAPASTWAALLNSFPEARKVLMTATPYRRDKKEIPGEFVYTYSVKQALEAGIYQEIDFVVAEDRGGDRDFELAQTAIEVLRREQARGLQARLLIRSDSISEAERIQQIYLGQGIQVGLVHSKNLRQSEQNIKLLNLGMLEGLVCIHMLSEGFDVPSLKIAVLHSPHRSLPATLQFVGRIARVGDARFGSGKIVARLTSDPFAKTPESDLLRLYQKDANWSDLLPFLAAGELEREIAKREFFSNFEYQGIEEISVRSVRPGFKAVVFKGSGIDPNWNAEPNLSSVGEVIFTSTYPEANCKVWITQAIEPPRWLDSQDYISSNFHLHIFFQEKETGLIFVHSETETTIERIQQVLTPGATRPEPGELDTLLSSPDILEIFNIGYANLAPTISKSARYTILAGRGADGSIPPSDLDLSTLGHGSARVSVGEGKASKVRGASVRSGKVWSSDTGDMYDFLAWCVDIAKRISSVPPAEAWQSPVGPMPHQRDLSIAREQPLIVDWHPEMYSITPPWELIMGELPAISFLDFNLDVRLDEEQQDNLIISANINGQLQPLCLFSCFGDKAFRPFHGLAESTWLCRQNLGWQPNTLPLLEIFRYYPPTILLSSGTLVTGDRVLKPRPPRYRFPERFLMKWDWSGTTITMEVNDPEDGTLNVQAATVINLVREWGEDTMVLRDHGSGEIADVVAVSFDEYERFNGRIGLFHCKASADSQPSIRVNDIYEVAMQAVKSLAWVHHTHLFEVMLQRYQDGRLTIEHGSEEVLNRLDQALHRSFKIDVFIVQPGLSVQRIVEAGDDQRLSLLASTYQWFQGLPNDLIVIGS